MTSKHTCLMDPIHNIALERWRRATSKEEQLLKKSNFRRSAKDFALAKSLALLAIAGSFCYALLYYYSSSLQSFFSKRGSSSSSTGEKGEVETSVLGF